MGIDLAKKSLSTTFVFYCYSVICQLSKSSMAAKCFHFLFIYWYILFYFYFILHFVCLEPCPSKVQFLKYTNCQKYGKQFERYLQWCLQYLLDGKVWHYNFISLSADFAFAFSHLSFILKSVLQIAILGYYAHDGLSFVTIEGLCQPTSRQACCLLK